MNLTPLQPSCNNSSNSTIVKNIFQFENYSNSGVCLTQPSFNLEVEIANVLLQIIICNLLNLRQNETCLITILCPLNNPQLQTLTTTLQLFR